MILSKRRAFVTLSVFLLLVFSCVLHYFISEKPVLDYLDKYKDAPVYIKAEITSAESIAVYQSTFYLKVFEINGAKVKKFNLFLTIFDEIGAGRDETGQLLEAYVVFTSLENGRIPDSGVNSFKSQGYYIAADYYVDYDEDEEPPQFKITPANSRSLNYYLESMRNYAGDVFFKNIKPDYHDNITQEAAVAYGIFTGNKNYIDAGVKSDFKKSGIAHVLAVSGLHLSILCGIIFAFLNLIKAHKKITCAVIILCCLFFMAFTGFSVSVIRSGVTLILFYSAFLIGRKSDSFTSLLIAGTFILLLNPYNIFNIGFQLSFFATLGIITVNSLNNKIMRLLRFKFLKITASSFIITIAATVFTLPFIAYNFKMLSLISPVANLVTAPLITAILFLDLCLMLFSFIPVILFVFSMPVYLITKLLLIITNYLGSFKYSYISVESTNGTGFYIFSAVFLVLVILCFLPSKKSVKRIVYTSTILAFLVMSGTLIYPRILFKDSARFAYYSDDRNQNIILFHKDYDYADIIDITHGTLGHVNPVCDIIAQNGALYINSIVLSDYRKRHVRMIKKYLIYSDINKIYIPEPINDYDTEVLNSLYYLSLTAGFELVKYGNVLKLSDDILITIDSFDYDKMKHQAVEIDYRTKKLLYLGIGYKEGYEKFTDIKNKSYDIVFYGSHKHNFRDDDYISDIYGTYAGVLSAYFDADKEKASQKLGPDAVDAYLSESVLFVSGDYNSVIFDVRKDGRIKHYLK